MVRKIVPARCNKAYVHIKLLFIQALCFLHNCLFIKGDKRPAENASFFILYAHHCFSRHHIKIPQIIAALLSFFDFGQQLNNRMETRMQARKFNAKGAAVYPLIIPRRFRCFVHHPCSLFKLPLFQKTSRFRDRISHIRRFGRVLPAHIHDPFTAVDYALMIRVPHNINSLPPVCSHQNIFIRLSRIQAAHTFIREKLSSFFNSHGWIFQGKFHCFHTITAHKILLILSSYDSEFPLVPAGV